MAPTRTVLQYNLGILLMKSNCFVCSSICGLCLFNKQSCCHLSEYILKIFILAGFLAHVKKICRLLDKFEVWVSCEAHCDIFDRFFFLFDFFETEFNLLQDLLNTEFTIIEIGLFHGGEHLDAKICRLPADFFGQHGLLYRGQRRVKTFHILVEFF